MKAPPPELERALLARNGKREREEIRFRCPHPDAHRNGDADPSASYNPDRMVWYCPVCDKGGGWKDLCELMGVPVSRGRRPKSRPTAYYVYREEGGKPLRRKVRWEPGFQRGSKSFTWEKPGSEEEWTKCKGDGNPKVLYHSEQLPAARESGATLWVVEGEKDADAAEALGLVAITNPEGAGKSKWKPAYAEQLRGLAVVILPDKDAPGRVHAEAIARSLDETAASVRIVELPGKSVKDLSDWIAAEQAAGASRDEIRLRLEGLAAHAPPWEPSPDAEEHQSEAGTGSKSDDEPTQSEILIRLADEGGVELFHTPEREAFALLPVDGHKETWRVRSKDFKYWLLQGYYDRTKKAPNAQALHDAWNTLAARALFEGEEREVHTRVAEAEGAIYLDLCSKAWEAVEITGTGWRVVPESPVRFRREQGMHPLPHPVPGGSIAELRPLVNLPDDGSFALFVAFLVAALRPRGPYPVLVLHGEQGSAKSTLARIARALVDPAGAPLRTIPRNEHDLMISASHGWLLAFDNLSGLKDWLSDAFCRLATGGGFSTRELYTDSDEVIFSATRPVVLNGIEEVVGRQDLVDRSLILSLPTIQDDRRRREDDLWTTFEALRPRLLGALLDAASCALHRQSTVRPDRSPRMADFAHWAVAAEPAFPWPAGAFLAAYEGNRQEAVEVSLEADVVATAARGLIEERGSFEGTSQELLDLLEAQETETVRRSRSWPRSARGLSSRLKRAAPALRQAGIAVAQGEREPGTGRRLVRLAQIEGAADRHNRHDRHEAPSAGASGCDANASPVTVVPSNRHSGDLQEIGLRDGRDGCDGPFTESSEPPSFEDQEELRL
jgi:hypothetical protein